MNHLHMSEWRSMVADLDTEVEGPMLICRDVLCYVTRDDNFHSRIKSNLTVTPLYARSSWMLIIITAGRCYGCQCAMWQLFTLHPWRTEQIAHFLSHYNIVQISLKSEGFWWRCAGSLGFWTWSIIRNSKRLGNITFGNWICLLRDPKE
jgi:hypothetical protein